MSGWAETRWSIVGALGAPADRDAYEAAWTHLVGTYRPVFRIVALTALRQYGADPGLRDEVDDVVDGFLARCHEKQWFARPDPARGTFRSFCCTAIRRHARDWLAVRRAKKRRPAGGPPERYEEASAAAGSRDDEVDGALDEAWTGFLVERALAATAARSQPGAELLRRLRADPDAPRSQWAAELGTTPANLGLRIFRARKIFAQELWSLVKDTCRSARAFAGERDRLRPLLARHLDAETHTSLFGA